MSTAFAADVTESIKEEATKSDKPFTTLIPLAFKIDCKFAENSKALDRFLEVLEIEKRTEDDELTQICLSSSPGGAYRNFMVRRFKDKQKAVDIILAWGGDTAPDEGYLFLTSTDGKLRRAVFMKYGFVGVDLPYTEAHERFAIAVEFWKGWEKHYKNNVD